MKLNRASRCDRKIACDENNAITSHYVLSCGIKRSCGLRGVISRRGRAWGPSVPRLHSMSNNMAAPDTFRLFQLGLQPAPLPWNNIGNCIASAIDAYVTFPSDISSIMECCEELDKEKRSSPHFWESAKLVFRTLSKTYWKKIRCSLHKVPLLNACKNAKNAQGWDQELYPRQRRACEIVQERSHLSNCELAWEDSQLHPKAFYRSCHGVGR